MVKSRSSYSREIRRAKLRKAGSGATVQAAGQATHEIERGAGVQDGDVRIRRQGEMLQDC